MKLLIALTLAASLSTCLPPPVVITPTPSPTATPTATATATPSPEITPIPPTPPSCKLPPSDGTCVDMPKDIPVYRDAVWEAQNKVAIAGKLIREDGSIPDELAYTEEVSRLLRVAGYCAIAGQVDETWVKKDNTFSEHYDIVRSDGVVINMYAARCATAKF